MKVLIVGRTKMGEHTRCIGGLTPRGPVRLLTEEGKHWPRSVPFQIGQVWEMNFRPAPELVAPHLEDVLVSGYELVKQVSSIPRALRHTSVRPVRGSIRELFGGLLGFTSNGSGFISHRLGVPNASTLFWLPEQDLLLREDERHYDTSNAFGEREGLAYVGEEPPISIIRAGILVRVSLARWWTPDPDFEERCYLQLSGWFSS